MKILKILFFLLPLQLFSQQTPPLPEWAYVLKGFYDVDLAGTQTDADGNIYAAGTYGGWMEVPDLKKRFDAPKHVASFLIKISKQGKTLWALPFLSNNDSRIRSIKLLKNQGVAVAGFCDHQLVFPSTNGNTKTHKGGYASFIATYSKDGKLEWARTQTSVWSEATSIDSDSSGNIYYTGYYRKGFSGDEIKIPDSCYTSSEYLIKYNPKGEIVWQQYFKNQVLHDQLDGKSKVFVSPDQKVYFCTSIKNKKIDWYKTADKSEINRVNRHSGFVLCLSETGDKQWIKYYGGYWAYAILDADFDSENNFHFVVDFGSEFYINEDELSMNDDQTSAPQGSSSGICWVALDNSGKLIDVQFHTGKKGAFNTRSRILQFLPDGTKIMGGEFTRELSFDNATNQALVISGQGQNHNSWLGLFSADNQNIALWKTLSTDKGFSFPICVSLNGNNLTSGFMCHEEQLVSLKSGNKTISKAERGRYTVITSSKLDMRTKLPDIPVLASCSNDKLIDVFIRSGIGNKSEAIAFLENRTSTESNAEIQQVASTDSTTALAFSSTNNQNSGDRKKPIQEAILYPNPAKEFTRLALNSNDPSLNYSLYSSTGCLLLKDFRKSENHQYDITINLSGLASGTYFLACESGSYRKVFRLIHLNE